MNVFSQLMLALLFSGSLVRSFTWTLYAWQGTPLDKENPIQGDSGMSLSLRAFIICYPQINVLVFSFLCQYPWLFDYFILLHGKAIYMRLREQLTVFVITNKIFIVVLYLVFMFSFPILSDDPEDDAGSKLFSLFNLLSILFFIALIILVC